MLKVNILGILSIEVFSQTFHLTRRKFLPTVFVTEEQITLFATPVGRGEWPMKRKDGGAKRRHNDYPVTYPRSVFWCYRPSLPSKYYTGK